MIAEVSWPTVALIAIGVIAGLYLLYALLIVLVFRNIAKKF
jgi:hypothetical protein